MSRLLLSALLWLFAAAAHADYSGVIPFVPEASAYQQAFLRLSNPNASTAHVTLRGLRPDGSFASGTIALSIPAHGSKQLNSGDLESGNPDKGLSGSFGAGNGPWTVVYTSDRELVTGNLLRTPDGFLTQIDSLRDQTPAEVWEVATFNPADNPNQQSQLWVRSFSSSTLTVRVVGRDDAGRLSGTVSFSLDARQAKLLTAAQLESGSGGLGGALGDGSGKWRFQVSANGPVYVASLLFDPNGYLTALAATATAGRSVGCDDLDGAYLLSGESAPRYLGFLGASYASDSVKNTVGTYGSSNSTLSINNPNGVYGVSWGSNYSARSTTATRPPLIVGRSGFLGYLTKNSSLPSALDTNAVLNCTFGSASRVESVP